MVLLFCVNDEIIRKFWTKNIIKVTHCNDTGLDMKCDLIDDMHCADTQNDASYLFYKPRFTYYFYSIDFCM